ncbi:MAG: tetratricopeptide repeat protein [Anaerolineae bacterium]|nr:tetratricopeptide repeat protein [Anaerolineae bacterium]
MDTITTAIITTLTARAANAEVEQKPALEAYETLKSALRRKYGPASDVVEAVEMLEKQPTSTGRQTVLREEIAGAKAEQDPALRILAESLLEKLGPTPTPSASRPTRPVSISAPLQRPERAESFTGRTAELAQLLAQLQPGRVVALYGPAGIGKSALAAAAVWKLAPGQTPPPVFPDGIFYHNFYNQSRVDIALEYIARTLGKPPTPTPYEAVQRALARRQALLVLDGVEQADDLAGLLELRGECGVLLTSRQRHEAVSEWQELSPLPPSEGIALLQAWGGWRATDQAATSRICELVGGVPLALRLAGQYLATYGENAAELLAWLENTRLNSTAPDQRQQESVALLLERSLSQVSETARQALAVAGLLALAPFDPAVIVKTLTIEPDQGMLASVRKIFKQKSQEPAPDVHRALVKLVDYGLLRQVGQRYEVSHSLIHNYVRQQLPAPAKSIRRLAACYVALAWEQSALGREGYARLDADRPHFLRVLTDCVEQEEWEAAYGLAAAIEEYLDRQEYLAERVIANEVGLMAAWQLGRPNEGDWLGNLGDTYRTMGHAKWAIEHFEQALATARQNGDRHSEGNSLGNLGLAYRDLGQTERAMQYLKQALAIFEKVRSPSADYVRQWLAELED